MALLCCLLPEQADTFRTHFWYARRSATPRDVLRHGPARESGALRSSKCLLRSYERCLARRRSDPPLTREGVDSASCVLGGRCGPPSTALETAVGPRGGELAAERASDRCDDHAHILCGQTGLVPHDVTAPVVDEALTCRHHVRRAARVVGFAVRQLALR